MEMFAKGTDFSEVETGLGEDSLVTTVFLTLSPCSSADSAFFLSGETGAMRRPGMWAELGIVSSPCCPGDRVLVVTAVLF